MLRIKDSSFSFARCIDVVVLDFLASLSIAYVQGVDVRYERDLALPLFAVQGLSPLNMSIKKYIFWRITPVGVRGPECLAH